MKQIDVKKREIWADYVKFIAIYLMAVCHFNLNSDAARQFIWIFHMPVFFLISGYFDKGLPFSKVLMIKNIKALIIPYFFFSILNISICWISPYLHPESYHNGTILQSFGKAILGMFLMEDLVRPYAFMPFLAGWFLIALFQIKILFSVLVTCWDKYKIAIPPIIMGIASLVYWHFPFFSVDSAALGLTFYIVGYLIKRYSLLDYIKNPISFFLFLFTLAYLYFIGMQNGIINIDGGEWGNSLIMFYVNGIIGSLGCIFLSKSINFNIPFISEGGRSTLSILGIHGFVGVVGKTFCVAILGYSPRAFPIMTSLIIGVIAMIIGIYVHRILFEYLPWSIGQEKDKLNANYSSNKESSMVILQEAENEKVSSSLYK